MKKYVAIFLALLLSFCFVGCNAKKNETNTKDYETSTKDYEKYTNFIVDTTNGEYSVNAEADYYYWTGIYFKKKNMPNKSCLVLGNRYFGSYRQSVVKKMDSYTTDIYFDENYIEFGLREDTGKLAYISFMNADFFDTQPYLPDVSDPYETAISFAKEIASEYVDNISDYTQIIEEPDTRYKERDGVTYEITYFTITFSRKINGYFSSDYIAVRVTSKGTLASIRIGDIGAFSNTTIDFDTAAMEQSISDKIESFYNNSELKVKKLNIDDQKLAITPDGYICMLSIIFVEVVDELDIEAKSGVVILTILGKK